VGRTGLFDPIHGLRCLLQCVAVCCSVLQCVAVCCRVLQCRVLQCVTENPIHNYRCVCVCMCMLMHVCMCVRQLCVHM